MRSRPVSGQCARADECSVGPEADKCLLERAYLQGCVPGAGSAGDGSAAMPEAEAEAGAFACGRAELYSFALARLFDIAPGAPERSSTRGNQNSWHPRPPQPGLASSAAHACALPRAGTADAPRVLAGRSGAARLRQAEDNLGRTSAWLASRMGLGGEFAAGDAPPPPASQQLLSGRVVPTRAVGGEPAGRQGSRGLGGLMQRLRRRQDERSGA